MFRPIWSRKTGSFIKLPRLISSFDNQNKDRFDKVRQRIEASTRREARRDILLRLQANWFSSARPPFFIVTIWRSRSNLQFEDLEFSFTSELVFVGSAPIFHCYNLTISNLMLRAVAWTRSSNLSWCLLIKCRKLSFLLEASAKEGDSWYSPVIKRNGTENCFRNWQNSELTNGGKRMLFCRMKLIYLRGSEIASDFER
jgi:hypothetical protein